MPAVFLDRLPLPSLQAYTVGSVLLLACSVHYALQVTSQMGLKFNGTDIGLHDDNGITYMNVTVGKRHELSFSNLIFEGAYVRKAIEVLYFMLQEPMCIWTLINMTYCCFILIGKIIQKLVFGDLRVSEQQVAIAQSLWSFLDRMCDRRNAVEKIVYGNRSGQESGSGKALLSLHSHNLSVLQLAFFTVISSEFYIGLLYSHIKDKFWNFVFYKFIFIFGVMNVQFMDEVVLWCSWFSILGFLHLLAQLCKDRCEYLSFSPATPKWTHCRVLMLLFGILSMSFTLFAICVFVGLHAGVNTFAFMAAECSLVSVRTLYVITRYAIYLLDATHEGAWEKRASYVYYTELGFELTALVIDFCHHLHMLVWGNIFLSMASLVIAMQLRCLFYEIKHRLKKYKNYLRIVKHMECNYPMATSEEIDKNNDDCAICWDHLDLARKLPCGHLFHNSCLRSWLEQDTSCPTCRKALSDSIERDFSTHVSDLGQNDILNREVSENSNQRNQYYHFEGSQYASWLPNFLLEVSHHEVSNDRQATADEMLQIDSMARQIQQMFPHMPINSIIDDLLSTKSMDITVENILDGKLVAPAPSFQGSYLQNTHEASIQASNSNQASLVLGKQQALCSGLDYIEDSVFPADSYDVEELERFPGLMSMHIASPLGCRFSKSPQEREQILAKRKEDLIKLARRKYLNKAQDSPLTS